MSLLPWTTSPAVLPSLAFAAILGVGTLTPNTVVAIDAYRPASCLDRFIDAISIRNDFGSSQYINDSRAKKIGFDAFGSIWRPESMNGEAASSSINVTAGMKGCWAGGRVLGLQSGDPLGDLQGAAAAISVSGLRERPIDFEFEWIEVSDVPHAIESSLSLNSLIIKNALFREIHGDCIELNGVVRTLIIRDSLIDGCSYLVNDRSGNFTEGDAEVLIRNSVIRLRAGSNEPPQSPIPLLTGAEPRIRVVGSVFLLDGPVPLLESLIVGAHATIKECRGNIVILGDGGAVVGELPPCFRVMSNQKVWTSKKEKWFDNREQELAFNDSAQDQDSGGNPDGEPDPNPDGEPDPNPDGDPDPNPDGDPDDDKPHNNLGIEWSDGTLWNDNTGWL
jgi:hypothetical protein